MEADPAKAAATKVTAIILEQFKGEKQLVFKFKKRKNYKKLRGHRQQLTRVQIESVGSAKAEKPAVKKAVKKDDARRSRLLLSRRQARVRRRRVSIRREYHGTQERSRFQP